MLWPVFHDRLDLAQFEAGYYQRYLEVNRRFARALYPLLRPDDTIWSRSAIDAATLLVLDARTTPKTDERRSRIGTSSSRLRRRSPS